MRVRTGSIDGVSPAISFRTAIILFGGLLIRPASKC